MIYLIGIISGLFLIFWPPINVCWMVCGCIIVILESFILGFTVAENENRHE